MSVDSKTTAGRDRSTLARLVDLLTEIAFDGHDYEGCDIQNDLVNLGVLQETEFDPERHTDHTGEAEPGDDWFDFTEYGRALIGRSNDDRRREGVSNDGA